MDDVLDREGPSGHTHTHISPKRFEDIIQEVFIEGKSLGLGRPRNLPKFKAPPILVEFSNSSFEVNQLRFECRQQHRADGRQ